jgi:hypothetical protein
MTARIIAVAITNPNSGRIDNGLDTTLAPALTLSVRLLSSVSLNSGEAETGLYTARSNSFMFSSSLILMRLIFSLTYKVSRPQLVLSLTRGGKLAAFSGLGLRFLPLI